MLEYKKEQDLGNVIQAIPDISNPNGILKQLSMYIDNLKYQICLFKAHLKAAHISDLFPEIVTSSSLVISQQYATDQRENKSHSVLYERST